MQLIETNNRFELLDKRDNNTQSINEPTIAVKKEAIPPVFIREKEKWLNVANGLKTKNINYTRATNTSAGVRVQPATSNDYRAMYKYLVETNVQFHTYDLNSEKPLKIVIHGIFQQINEEDIEKDL